VQKYCCIKLRGSKQCRAEVSTILFLLFQTTPVTGMTYMAGIWNALKNDNMTAHDSRTVVDNLLAAALPGFTRIQPDALGRCIINETKSLAEYNRMR